MNIILIGLRGTGKTTLGEQLARTLEMEWLDTDREVEKHTGLPIGELIKTHGWETFRAHEKEVALTVAARTDTVISTGGGTIMDSESADALKRSGVMVLLVCDLALLRIYLEAGHERPSLTEDAPAHDEIEKIWEERKARYHALADIVHDTTDWPSSLERLLDKLRTHPKLGA